MAGEKVTLRDVYDAVNRLEDKMDRRISDVEQDVSDLQSFQNKALGILSIFSLFTTAAATFLWNKVVGGK